MYPRQSLTPRCSAKPARHPAHPDVDPHAVFKTQLALRLKKTPKAEMLPSFEPLHGFEARSSERNASGITKRFQLATLDREQFSIGRIITVDF